MPKSYTPLLMLLLAAGLTLASSPRQAVMGDMIKDENYMLINPAAAFKQGSFVKVELGNADLNSEWAMGNYVFPDLFSIGVHYGRRYANPYNPLSTEGYRDLESDPGMGIIVAGNEKIPLGMGFYTAPQKGDRHYWEIDYSLAGRVYYATMGAEINNLSLSFGYVWDVYKYSGYWPETGEHFGDSLTKTYAAASIKYDRDIGEHDHLSVFLGREMLDGINPSDQDFDLIVGYETIFMKQLAAHAALTVNTDKTLNDISNAEIYTYKLPQLNLGFEMPVVQGSDFSIAARAGCQISYVTVHEQGIFCPGSCPLRKSYYLIADDDYIALGLGAEWKDFQLDMSLDDELVLQTALSYNF